MGVRRVGHVFVALRVRLRRVFHEILRNSRCNSLTRAPRLFWHGRSTHTGVVTATVSKMSTTSAQKCRGRIQRQGRRPSLRQPRQARNYAPSPRQGLLTSTHAAVIRDAKTLARIRALVLPPAWTDVWISTDPRAHLQATGHDAAGRKQYRYHADWTTERNSTKYHRMLAFAEVLPSIRAHSPRLDGPGVLPSARAGDRRRAAGARPTFASATRSTRGRTSRTA